MRDTIAVYALWQDSEPHIQRTLSQFEGLEDLDYDFEYYFYENDSKDNTVSILEDWMLEKKGVFLHENLNAEKFGSVADQQRMTALCEFRNKCKNLLEDSISKYTILIDSDIIFDKSNLKSHIDFLKSNEDAVMVTPNIRQNIQDYLFGFTEDSFYDVYPLFDKNGDRGLYWTDCPFRNGLDRMNWSLGRAIKCNSAFGGFALTYTKILKKVKWSTSGDCDHVNFCKELSDFGSIYLNPKNKVRTELDLKKYNLNNFKIMAKSQKIN